MTAWDELQQWLMLNVGSKEADECLGLVDRVVSEIIDTDIKVREMSAADVSEMIARAKGEWEEPLPEIDRNPLPYWKNK